jgi:hypothetical protein
MVVARVDVVDLPGRVAAEVAAVPVSFEDATPDAVPLGR